MRKIAAFICSFFILLSFSCQVACAEDNNAGASTAATIDLNDPAITKLINDMQSFYQNNKDASFWTRVSSTYKIGLEDAKKTLKTILPEFDKPGHILALFKSLTDYGLEHYIVPATSQIFILLTAVALIIALGKLLLSGEGTLYQALAILARTVVFSGIVLWFIGSMAAPWGNYPIDHAGIAQYSSFEFFSIPKYIIHAFGQLGASVAGTDVNVSSLTKAAINVFSMIWSCSGFLERLGALFIGTILLWCYVKIASCFIQILVEIYLVVCSGTVLLAFAALEQTREMFFSFIRYCISAGLKYFAICVIAGIAIRFAELSTIIIISLNLTNQAVFSVLGTLLCVGFLLSHTASKVPDMAATVASMSGVHGGSMGSTGAFIAGGLGPAMAALTVAKTAVKTAVGVAAPPVGAAMAATAAARNAAKRSLEKSQEAVQKQKNTPPSSGGASGGNGTNLPSPPESLTANKSNDSLTPPPSGTRGGGGTIPPSGSSGGGDAVEPPQGDNLAENVISQDPIIKNSLSNSPKKERINDPLDGLTDKQKARAIRKARFAAGAYGVGAAIKSLTLDTFLPKNSLKRSSFHERAKLVNQELKEHSRKLKAQRAEDAAKRKSTDSNKKG